MIQSMLQRRGRTRQGVAALVAACLFFWTAFPATAHVPTFVETVQDHLERVEDHGHSHGLDVDLLWALHGHHHDAADHDHSVAVLVRTGSKPDHPFQRDAWRPTLADASSFVVRPPERPPRQ